MGNKKWEKINLLPSETKQKLPYAVKLISNGQSEDVSSEPSADATRKRLSQKGVYLANKSQITMLRVDFATI